MSELQPLTPVPSQISQAFKWLDDLSALGNPNAALIQRILTGTLLESQRLKACLLGNLAPLLQVTIGKNVAKLDIVNALRQVSDLLGGPPPPAAGPAPAPGSPLVGG